MSRSLGIILSAMVLFLGLDARAEKVLGDYNVFMAQQMTKQLSAGLRYKDVFGSFKAQGAKDREILKMILQTYGEQKMPVARQEGRTLLFSTAGAPLQVELVDYLMGKIRVNNQVLDFRSQRTLADKLSYVERILARQNHSSSGGSSFWMILKSTSAEAADLRRALSLLGLDSWVGFWSAEPAGESPEQIKIGRTIQYMQNEFVIKAGKKNLRVDLSQCSLKQGAIWANGNDLVFSWSEHDQTPLSEMMRDCCENMRKQCEAEMNRVFPASNEKPMSYKDWQSTH